MSWSWLDKIGSEVTKYSTFFGQLWYGIVFVSRLTILIDRAWICRRSQHGFTHLELDDYYGRSRSSSRSERGETSFGLRSPNPVNFEHQHTLTYPSKKLPYYHEHERHLSSPDCRINIQKT